MLTSPEGSGEPPGLSAQEEKAAAEEGALDLCGRGEGTHGCDLTCAHVLLKFVAHVHELPEEGWPCKPLGPSSRGLHLT